MVNISGSYDGVHISNGALEEYLSNKGSWIIWIGAFSCIVPKAVEGIVLWQDCVKRAFEPRQKNIVMRCVFSSIGWIIIPLIVGHAISNKISGEISFTTLAYMMLLLVIGWKITYAVMYYKAAECERKNVYYEDQRRKNETGSWICHTCQTENPNSTAVCSKCRGYKESVNQNDGWICKECDTVNDKKDLYCKFCGKYK